ncbi:winged helix-turn-helix domain-containing protein [Shewanella sp. YLB-07]|uniref:winged helix-turn-helix domain-containing protein n=1 Tax=Shewanella sp. YLB-07 TaxID=2601268 RepID=UPI00128B7666|nr:winged helix-turn-helix domain-containing protein [Shewanella sp. YLB-07]MPY24361.1 hypothetical protein [Shewanella sp. YLB-07]
MNIIIDENKRSLVINEMTHKVAKAEISLLVFLYENQGHICSREQLASNGWPDRVVSSNSVPVAIGNLRKISARELITTVDEGYILNNSSSVTIKKIPSDSHTESPQKKGMLFKYLLLTIILIAIMVMPLGFYHWYKINDSRLYYIKAHNTLYYSNTKQLLVTFFDNEEQIIERKQLEYGVNNTFYVINKYSKVYIIDCINQYAVNSISTSNLYKAKSFTKRGEC